MKLRRKGIAKGIILFFILATSFTLLSSVTTVYGSKVDEYHFCSSVNPETRQPSGKGPFFFTHSIKAFFWVKVSEVNPGQILRFEWWDPDDYPVTSTTVTVQSAEAQEYWDSIPIEGDIPAQSPGTWNAYFYIDDELKVSQTFVIIEIGPFLQEITELRSTVEQLQDSVAQYSQDYNAIKQNYDDLTSEYTTKQTEYESLKDSYDNLQEEYDNLLEEYNSVQINESVLKDLRNTRNIMYVTSAAAIVLFIGVIYLVVKK